MRGFQVAADLREVIQHVQVLTAEASDGDEHFQVVPVMRHVPQIRVQKTEEFLVFRARLRSQFEPPRIVSAPIRLGLQVFR